MRETPAETLVFRAKHDAWLKLGGMGKEEAMEEYIEALKQIIETMNFTEDVEKFIEVNTYFNFFVNYCLGPWPIL